MAHTPGPWKVMLRDTQRHSVYKLFEDSGGHWILADEITTEANARLIAAAPELLEACKAFIEVDAEKECPYCSKQDWGVELHDADCPFALAYAAIAKAEGTA